MAFRPPAGYIVKSNFMAMYAKCLTSTLPSRADVSRIVSLRCSQLPLCPLSIILDFALKGLDRPMDLMKAYYVGVGHVVHAVMQDYLSRSGMFLADYYCKVCGTHYPLSHVHSCCGQPTNYEEVLISFLGIGGHIDGIFRDQQGYYWILDFKTTSVAGAEKKQTKPGDAYEEQVEAYAYLLYRQYGIRVKGAILCFLPRDDPRKPVLWVRELDKIRFREIHERLKGYRKTHAKMMVAETAEDIMALAKHRCSNPYCSYCKLSKSELRGVIAKALKTKNKLPLESLRKLVENTPEGMVSVSRLSPNPFVKFDIPIPKLQGMSDVDMDALAKQLKRRVATINKLTAKLER